MAKRTLVPWEWDGVDVDPSAPVGKKGDKRMKCKWCGDEFSGGPSRIRAHHSKPLLLPGEKDKGYKLCSSKANAALEFKAKCTAAQEQSQAKKIKKTERDAAVAKQTVAVAFHKESQKLAKKGVV